MAAPSAGLEARRLTGNKNLAILVIHGIGQQNPYETLDGFVRGLDRYYSDKCKERSTLYPERIQYVHGPRICVHLEPPAEAACAWRKISVFEYYWAPETEDKVTYRESLLFLLRTGIRPLRELSLNLQEFLRAGKKPSVLRVIGMFVREMYRATLIFLPLVFVLGVLLWWLANPPSLSLARTVFLQFLRAAPWWITGTFTICSTLVVVLVVFLLQQIGSLTSRRCASTEKHAEMLWFTLAVACVLLFLGIARVLWISHPALSESLRRLIWNFQVIAVFVTLASGYFVKSILTGFVGDIAVYVTADEKSKNYAARRSILKGSCELAKDLLCSEDYDELIIAGHSLGSVIAYDTINKLIGDVCTRSAAQSAQDSLTERDLAKLSGLLTFGSPLDKIYYFFREHVGKDQAIRAQLLSYIHPFRRKSSWRDYGTYKFEKYEVPDLKVRWSNVWCPLDPVSGHLDFYNVDVQSLMWYWIPGVAHLSYWKDKRFYHFLVEELIESGKSAKGDLELV